MKKNDNRRPAIRRGRVLPDDACPTCGTMMAQKRSTLSLPLNGEKIAVPYAVHLRCPKCAEIVLRYQDAKRLDEDAIAIYRERHGLLSADEIRSFRERLGLSQAD